MEDVRLRVTETEVLKVMDCGHKYLQDFLSYDPSVKKLYEEFVDNHPDRIGFRKVVNTRHVVERAGNVIGYKDTRVLVATDLSKLTQVDLYVRFVAGLVERQLKPGGIWDKWPSHVAVDGLCQQALMILRYLESGKPIQTSLPASNEPSPLESLSYRSTPLQYQTAPQSLLSPSPATDSNPPPDPVAPRKPQPKRRVRKRKVAESESMSPEAEQEGSRKRTDFATNAGSFIRTFAPDDNISELIGTREERIEALKKQIAARESGRSNAEDARHAKMVNEARQSKEAGEKRIAALKRDISERNFGQSDRDTEGAESDVETSMEEARDGNIFWQPKPSESFFKRTF